MFAKKLESIVSLLEITNNEFARNVGLDPSYVSRLRTGKRNLPKNPDFLPRMAEYFVEVADEKNRIELLQQTIGALESEDREELVKSVTGWLYSEADISKLVLNLLRQIPEEDLENVVSNYSSKHKEEISNYYYGIEGRKSANIRIFKEMLMSEEPKKFIWYSDEPMSWVPYEGDPNDEYIYYLTKVLQAGHEIEIVYNSREFGQIVNQYSYWLSFLMLGSVKAYEYKQHTDPNLLRTQCAVPGVGALLSLPSANNRNGRATIYLEDEKMIQTMMDDLNYLIAQSTPIASVISSKDFEGYKAVFEKMNKNQSNIYQKDLGPSFFTLPEDLAKKIDVENPDLNFLEKYRYGKEVFEYMLEDNQLFQSIETPYINQDSYRFLFGNSFIEYSKEDYVEHLKEVISLLKEVTNYNMLLSKPDDSNVAIVISEGGVMAERFKEPRSLVFFEEKVIVKAFMNYFKDIASEAIVKDKDEVIRYLEGIIKNLT